MNLAAVFPPMATPFRDGKVDAPSIVFNVERWIHAGTGGVVALGSNGEAPFLSEEESDRVIAAAREGVPRDKTLIAGTGREGTPATIDATRRHYTAVADASPVPVLLYNFTAVTGVNITADAVARLAEHPNIAGIKESGSDMAQVSAFLDATPRASFAVIAGSAPTLFPALALGALGAILAVAGVAPELCVRIYDAVRAGRYDEARELQKRLTPLARLVTTAHGVPGLKAAMDLAGYRGGPPRMPLTPAPPEAVDQIRAELAHLREAV